MNHIAGMFKCFNNIYCSLLRKSNNKWHHDHPSVTTKCCFDIFLLKQYWPSFYPKNTVSVKYVNNTGRGGQKDKESNHD